MSREQEILKRIEKDLDDEGVVSKKVWDRSDEPDLPSFREFMIDMRLQGLDPNREEVWEHMKKIINRLTGQAMAANTEYEKLHRDYRILRKTYEDLIKEK